MNHYRLGIDIGGTFTDLVLLDAQGRARSAKVLTTSHDPLRGLLEGVRLILGETAVTPEHVAHVVHGTTLITNAVIEMKGARTALLTTAGFEDVLEIGREQRYDLYDLEMRMPDPIVRRRLRLGVVERTDARGEIREPVDAASIERAIEALTSASVEAVAICFLHAYRNAANERQVAEMLRRALPGVAVTTSHEVLPEIREYERVSTTVLNAYVQPLARR